MVGLRTLFHSRNERHNFLMGVLFASPWLIGFLLLQVLPLAQSLYYSFTRYDLLTDPIWIGARNYTLLLTSDEDFRIVMQNTIWWVVISSPLGVISAFLMALLLNTNIVARSAFRSVFFFPSIVPTVVVAFVWQFLLNVQYGAINGMLQDWGLPVIPFLSNPSLVKPSLVLIHMWAQGGAMVIFLMVSPVILFNLVLALIGGFQNFTLPWLMTQGGPLKATEFFAIFLYRNAFQYLLMGKASALAWFLFVIIVLFTIFLFRASGRFVYYAGSGR
jgi:multiple sugar transport system permease protein